MGNGASERHLRETRPGSCHAGHRQASRPERYRLATAPGMLPLGANGRGHTRFATRTGEHAT
jgi:hypothetical protein